MHRPRLAARVILAAGAILAFGTLPACGGGDSKPVVATKRDRKDEVASFTQIMLVYHRPGGPKEFTRSKEDTQKLAESLLAKILGGASMEPLVLEHTDDLDETGKPFNRGTYTIARRGSPVMEVVKDAVFSTKVGAVHPRVIDTGVAYLVLRRDE